MEYPKFKVCCRCFTFNQAKYITDAMNGFTMQQTSFPFVCTIVDDASTDGEQEVIRKYVEENFDFSEGSVAYHKETDYAHITYAQHKTNKNCYFAILYLKENHYSQHKPKMGYLSEWRDMCEYEAICEGDDYWIDATKLEKQADFLDNNRDYAMCYSKCRVFLQRQKVFQKNKEGGNYETLKEFINGNVVPTPTTMFRLCCEKKYILDINPESKHWLMGDYPLWLYFSHNWKIKFMSNDLFSVYRKLDNSASHSTDYAKKKAFVTNTFEIAKFFAEFFNMPNLYDENRLQRSLFSNAFLYGNLKEAKQIYKTVYKKTPKIVIKYILCHSKFLYNTLGKSLFSVIK